MIIEPDLRTRLNRYLPADMMAELPDPQAMAAAVRRLDSLYQALSSFLPQYIAEDETLYTENAAYLRPGTFLFADVSGFTALSEQLQRTGGDAGTEILTRVINDFFATMLEILAKSNGQLLKFAGDALEAFFPAPRRRSEVPLAIRTGLRMQRAMRDRFQPIAHSELTRLFGTHNLELNMSIGICQGKLFEAVVGNMVQRDHIIQGTLPGMAMEAEEAGERDDVIITASLQAAHSDTFDMVAVGDGFYHVLDNFGDELSDYEFVVPNRRRGQSSAIFGLEQDDLLADLQSNLERLERISRFVAAQIVNRVAAGGGEMEPENRPATIIFNHVTGFADLLETWGEEHLPLILSRLEDYYNLMQQTIANNGGSLIRTDPYRRGIKMLITFGAPVAHPDDPERAVTTALEMNRQLAHLNTRFDDEQPDNLPPAPPITQHLGITQGAVYAGEVGWKSRREYTVMGDDVNLAARLMSRGQPGEILISQRVWERVHPHFETEALPPMHMKGKSEPVQAYLVQASTASVLSMSPTSDTPFVGRDLHLLSLTYALQQAKGPRRRQAFAIVGEIGAGKTRMAKQVVQAADEARFQMAWANCQLSHMQKARVWPALVFQLLQLEQARSVKAQRRLLHTRLNEFGVPQLEPALTAMFFGADQSAAEAALSEKPLSEQDAIAQFLAAYTREVPALLVIDDLHLADPATLRTLQHVLEQIQRARLVILATYEPREHVMLPIRRKVNMSDLDEDETADMIARVLGVQIVGPRLRELVWQRTSGRPLFIESLLELLRDDGHVTVTDGQAELNTGAQIDTLPDDVRAIIISRIDHLSAEARTVLQCAAVLGDEFTVAALLALVENIDEIRLENLLGELVATAIIETPDGAVFRFRHGLTQTTAYENLNRVHRQKLHCAAAEWLQASTEAERHTLRILHHWIAGGDPARGVKRLKNAARAAENNRQIARAVELYTGALELLPQDKSMREELERLTSLLESL